MGLWVIKAEGCYWLIKGLTLDAFLWIDFYSCIAVPKWPEFTSPLQAEILFPLNIQEKSPRAVLEKSVVVKCMLEEACRRVDTHTHTHNSQMSTMHCADLRVGKIGCFIRLMSRGWFEMWKCRRKQDSSKQTDAQPYPNKPLCKA